MRANLLIAVRYAVITTLIFGVGYPLIVTGAAQLLFKDKANGQLIVQDGQIIGSKLIGQSFTSAAYFHTRPSAAGDGYDASNSGGSNLGPTSQKLVSRMKADAASAALDNPGHDVPVDLVTTSASGLDPDITPAAAEYQAGRIAQQRSLSKSQVETLIARHTQQRQFGFLGEARVNVLALNLDLDRTAPRLAEKR